MLPLYPPYAINDLAHEHLAGRLPDGRPRHRHRHHADPDGFLDIDPALRPDPLYMGLRHVVTHDPIGRLAAWFARRAEARSSRAADQRGEPGLRWTARPTAEPLILSAGDDPHEEREAA